MERSNESSASAKQRVASAKLKSEVLTLLVTIQKYTCTLIPVVTFTHADKQTRGKLELSLTDTNNA